MEEKEKRAHKRLEVKEIEVEYTTGDKFVKDFVKNISLGGMFIETMKPLAPGTIIKLKFIIPGQKVPINLKGEVRWTSYPKDVLRRTHPPGMGIKFIDLTERKLSSLRNFIEKLSREKEGES